jgi:hypothetical protein
MPELDASDQQQIKQLIELQNSKIEALQAELDALKSRFNQHFPDAAPADKQAGHSSEESKTRKRPRIPTITLVSGSPVLPVLEKLMDDVRAELTAHPNNDKNAHELNGLVLDALPQGLIPALQDHTKLSQTQLLELSPEQFSNRLLEFGLEMDHHGRYATFFQHHGSVRAAIMAGSSLNRAWVDTRAPGGSAAGAATHGGSANESSKSA